MRCERFQLRAVSRRYKTLDLEARFVAAFFKANFWLAPLGHISVNPRTPAARWQSRFEKPVVYWLWTTPAPEPPYFGG
jgi:hypothetical protein